MLSTLSRSTRSAASRIRIVAPQTTRRAISTASLNRYTSNGVVSSTRSSQSATTTVDKFSSTFQQLSASKMFNSLVLPRAYSTSESGKDGEKVAEAVDAEAVDASSSSSSSSTAATAKPETVTGAAKKHEFQAETKKLLDIVANSLYSEKEVFVREVISNASDALEKLRYLQNTAAASLAPAVAEKHHPLAIKLTCDDANNTFTIEDSGIGMTEEELIKNLGTIAHSGSKAFVSKVTNEGSSASAKDNIIGQFGVGFYSMFMVADKVTVFSRSAKADSKGYMWTSDGFGTYEIAEAENVNVGTKIVVHLKKDEAKYASKAVIEDIIKKYSNFVGFSISLNGTPVNTLQALWLKNPRDITEEMHTEFYRFIADTFDSPTYTLQYSTDSPINIRSLFYFPQTHMEKFGLGRTEPGVSLYSRKVLIQAKSKQLLPEWLRFVKGVVDSEDLPLNLSREILQNNVIINKLRTTLTTRVIRFLQEQVKKDEDKYDLFFNEFGNFFREGVCTDPVNKNDIAKLLRFESSKTEGKKKISLEEYINRTPNETSIYYLCVPNRELALQSPYYESFKEKGVEVLFLYEPLDDIVMQNLGTFNSRSVVSIESSKASEKADDASASNSSGWVKELSDWMKTTLGENRVSEVRVSTRLVSHPAIAVDHESAAMRRMMRMIDTSRTYNPPVVLEINPKHPIIIKLAHLKDSNPAVAKEIANQIIDNSLIAAGVLDDARSILGRINTLMEHTLNALVPDDAAPPASSSSSSSSSSSTTTTTTTADTTTADTASKEEPTKTA